MEFTLCRSVVKRRTAKEFRETALDCHAGYDSALGRLAQSHSPRINRCVVPVQITRPGSAPSRRRTATVRASPTSETIPAPASAS